MQNSLTTNNLTNKTFFFVLALFLAPKTHPVQNISQINAKNSIKTKTRLQINISMERLSVRPFAVCFNRIALKVFLAGGFLGIENRTRLFGNGTFGGCNIIIAKQNSCSGMSMSMQAPAQRFL